MNKQNKIIVGVIALVLALTVGYALFNSTLTINGTAKASGEFIIKFKEIGEIKESGSKGATAQITGGNNEILSVNVPNLEYPTSYVEIPVIVVNDGTIDGKLTGITVENLETDDIKVTYSGISEGEVFKQKEEKTMLIRITWVDNSVVEASNLKFQIGLKYQQITVSDIETTPVDNNLVLLDKLYENTKKIEEISKEICSSKNSIEKSDFNEYSYINDLSNDIDISVASGSGGLLSNKNNTIYIEKLGRGSNNEDSLATIFVQIKENGIYNSLIGNDYEELFTQKYSDSGYRWEVEILSGDDGTMEMKNTGENSNIIKLGSPLSYTYGIKFNATCKANLLNIS